MVYRGANMSWNPDYYKLSGVLEHFFYDTEIDFKYDPEDTWAGDWISWLNNNPDFALYLDIALTKIEEKRRQEIKDAE